jgi:hypothetical protein
MAVREYELFHGAVLTRLVRNDRPVALRMIETKPGEAWSTYRINDAVNVLIKHSTNPRKLKRNGGGLSWQFVFSQDQLSQLRQHGVWVALVCGAAQAGHLMEICVIDPGQIAQLIDLASREQQSVTVKYFPGKSLRASSARTEIIIPRNRLGTWAIPGS